MTFIDSFLAEHYDVPKRNVRIESGLKSRQKRVVIDAPLPPKRISPDR